ncbi:tellurite resistance TerB C-terminal domain-containing protein [uncultured Methanoregula sp.]|uniref:tellurite resistance TerB C-terminal domain-containing protein n=1 Tax=uncultured Methanoregula sp. TaxID=1005933 RepID=UPI002AAB53C7|nr:tellurite resistance TerB C-terminal domain-containing protein [uncultured Methanoregula sp.]
MGRRKKITNRDIQLFGALIVLIIAIISAIAVGIAKLLSAIFAKKAVTNPRTNANAPPIPPALKITNPSSKNNDLAAKHVPISESLFESNHTTTLSKALSSQEATETGETIENPMTYWSEEVHPYDEGTRNPTNSLAGFDNVNLLEIESIRPDILTAKAPSWPKMTITREAYCDLPGSLKTVTDHPDLVSWQQLISSKVPTKGTVLVQISELTPLLGIEKRQVLTPTQSAHLTSTAYDIGFALIPDHTVSGTPYKTKDSVAVVQIPDKKLHLSKNFQRIALIFELAYAISDSDDKISDEDERILNKFISGRSSLNPFEVECMRSLQRVLEVQPPSIYRIGKRLNSHLNPDQKIKIANFLSDIALNDGKFSKSEQKSMRSVFKALEIDPSVSEKIFKKLLVPPPEEPVSVISSKKSRIGEKISPTEELPAFKIDEEKLRQRILETQEVQAILGTVFEQENIDEIKITPEPVVQPTDPVATENEITENVNLPFSNESLMSLDTKYLYVLNDIMKKSEMSQVEFSILVKSHNLMPRGVFDEINSWAESELDLNDYLLEEREDRIIVNFER